MDPPPRVLIVDDDLAIRSLLTVTCRRLGFSCDTVIDGREALDRLRRAAYDVVLLDLEMPHVTGYEIIEEVRASGYDVEIVVITAHDRVARSCIAIDHVVRAIMGKPFDLDRVAGVLTEIIAVRKHSGRES